MDSQIRCGTLKRPCLSPGLGTLVYFWVVLLCPLQLLAQATPDEPVRESVTLQLRWHHQFQFAGYYAALARGYYRDNGLDVEIVAGSPQRRPVDEVLADRAQYGVDNSGIILARLQGQPFILLAAIFQHSPHVLLTLASSGLTTPRDLIGKTVMSNGGENDANFRAMFQRQGVSINQLNWIPSSFQLQDLIEGRTDAYNAYVTNEPFLLETMGLDYAVINPGEYGVNFYSDMLFTSERELAEHPDRVRRFREASLRGWRYALSHHEEVIQLIRQRYNSTKSLNHMRYEALATHEVVMPDIVEIGYISRERIEEMAKVLLSQRGDGSLRRLDGFIYRQERDSSRQLTQLLQISLAVLGVALVLVFGFAGWSRKLKREVDEHVDIEKKLKVLAETDSLTRLLNRRAFSAYYAEELARAQRYAEPFSIILLDLDEFKAINDRYGHDAGDRVLTAVAGQLEYSTRENDRCSRFGGEEFIILLPNTREVDAVRYAQRLCDNIRALRIEVDGGETVSITVSIGVAEWQSGDEKEMTINKADKALYQAKETGRDRARVWRSIA